MKKGFTLMEVVVVLAIIAILGAIIVPGFLGYTDRAKLRGDIQSTRVIQNAIDLYKAEVGKDVAAAYPVVGDMVAHLASAGYLEGPAALQTDGAVWVYNAASRKIRINVINCADGVKSVKLSDIEETLVIRQ